MNESFDNIKNDFLKYVNILSNDSSINSVMHENAKVLAISKYAKIGISKLGISLLSSDCDINNYTVLPSEYENQYFYTYILSLYLKIYLKKLNYEFKEGKEQKQIEATRRKFIAFTKRLWIQEITSEDMGSLYYSYVKDVLEIDKLYNDVKNKYNILYSELKIEKNERLTGFIVLVLIATLVFNVANFFISLK